MKAQNGPPLREDGQFYAEILRSGLQDRIVVAPFQVAARSWQLVYLQSGTLEIGHGNHGEDPSVQTLAGPGLVCQPVQPRRTIRLIAGSVGAHLAIEEFGMAAAVSSKPEAVELRLMAEDAVALPLSTLPGVDQDIAHAFRVILSEMESTLPGQETIVEAQLRYLLVQLWRHGYRAKDTLSQDAAQTILLRRFRQLVEAQFRKRWRVTDYALALGTTPDRLHSLATKTLSRTPLALIHERSRHEAKALLVRSNMTVEQIAEFLGFHSAAQFNQFFCKHEGTPPGRYRKSRRAKPPNEQLRGDASLTDWP